MRLCRPMCGKALPFRASVQSPPSRRSTAAPCCGERQSKMAQRKAIGFPHIRRQSRIDSHSGGRAALTRTRAAEPQDTRLLAMTQVVIIDYGVGNLRSVEKAFAATGGAALVSSDEQILRQAERLVLPGVGAFGACMKALTQHGFDELVRERVAEGTPVLGVCVGMQLLFEESEEFGGTLGLGLLRGKVQRFADDLPVPHVGW